MPKNLTGAPSWNNTVVTPADGDLADAASLETAIQQLANNARWLYDVLTVQGTPILRTAADLGALKVLTDMAHGHIANVPRFGLYVYVDPNASAEELPWRVAPAVGTGRWIHPLDPFRNLPGGVAMLEANGKVTPSRVPNRIVAIKRWSPGGGFSTTFGPGTPSSAVVDLDGSRLTFDDVAVGDILMAWASLTTIVDTNTVGQWRMGVIQNGVAGYQADTIVQSTATQLAFASMQAMFEMGYATPFTLKLERLRVSGTGNVYATYPSSMTAMLIRP